MKALRSWMRENEKMRGVCERRVSARAADQMRDIIMVMADALEEIGGPCMIDYLNVVFEVEKHDPCKCPRCIATSAQEKIEEIVG